MRRRKKITRDALKFLICTVFDFPEASDYERMLYLNKYGPSIDDNITERTVSRVLNKYLIKLKHPCFSVKERNTFSNMVLRYIWARKMKDIAQEPNTLLVFVDEAAVVLGKYNYKARGFYSVIPIVNKPLNAKKMSILVAVIPGFGTIYKWFNKSVKGYQYATFLREVSYICRSILCNPSTQIVIIQDNCSIHKTLDVLQEANKCKLNMFYTIPYSPQLNLLVENYFAQLKFYTIYKFSSVPNEHVDPEFISQHKKPPYILYIMEQWENKTEKHYNAERTAHIYGAWMNVLNTCIHGMPLSGQHIHQVSN